MRMAINKAIEGREVNGGGPFGAVIARNGELICKAHNLVKGEDDLTQHAELRAIQIACSKLGREYLKDCILYTSCEPCMMCLGACHWAGFKKIYYGASAEDARDHGYLYSGSYFDIDAELRRSDFGLSQILRDEALEVWKK